MTYPLIAGGRVFVTFRDPIRSSDMLAGLDATTGQVAWARSIGRGARPAYKNGRVFALDAAGVATAVDAASGATLWVRFVFEPFDATAPVARNGLLYMFLAWSGGSLYALDQTDGTTRWRAGATYDAGTPAVDGRYVYVTDGYDCATSASDALTGVTLWAKAFDCWYPGGEWTATNGAHVVTSAKQILDAGGLRVPVRARRRGLAAVQLADLVRQPERRAAHVRGQGGLGSCRRRPRGARVLGGARRGGDARDRRPGIPDEPDVGLVHDRDEGGREHAVPARRRQLERVRPDRHLHRSGRRRAPVRGTVDRRRRRGRADPAQWSWRIDLAAPDTTITDAPSGETGPDGIVSFDASELGTFQCRLDAGPWRGCGSPHTLTGLAAGGHTFAVRAIDQAGNADSTPASAAWTVAASAPPPQGGDDPPGPQPLPTGPPLPTPTATPGLPATTTRRPSRRRRSIARPPRWRARSARSSRREGATPVRGSGRARPDD